MNIEDFNDGWLEEQPMKKGRLSKSYKKTMKKMRDGCRSADKFAEKVNKNNWKSKRKNKGDTLG